MSILTVVGIINDPTTAGVSDSKQALDYYEPKADKR
ncbi:TPA: phage holin [Streptococcus suis]